ncbi:hypothetical protein BC833DRAFT_659912 [Globomyces pollinis-pini]|nr:hypothetical protein BC833DRAFT_659912 [Globomyces pollinis-pini]
MMDSIIPVSQDDYNANISKDKHSSMMSFNVELEHYGIWKSSIQIPTLPVRLDETRKTMANIANYSHHHGIPFFFRNNHMVDTTTKAAYWGKMDVIEHYLNAGFEWVIWTDIDVLFINFNQSLVDLWLKNASDQHSLAFVLECAKDSPVRFGPVRSGFFAVRNSPDGYTFLKAWRDMFSQYRFKPNPEQTALEDMVQVPQWKNMSFISPPDGIHTYPDCYEEYDKNPISIHFPGTMKNRVDRYWDKLGFTNQQDFDIIFETSTPAKPASTKDECFGLVCVKSEGDLRHYLTKPKNRDDMLTIINRGNQLGFGFAYVLVSDFVSKSYKTISNILKTIGINYSTVFKFNKEEGRINRWNQKYPTFAKSDDDERKIEHLLIMKHAFMEAHTSALIIEEYTDWSMSASTLLNWLIPTLPPDWDYITLYSDPEVEMEKSLHPSLMKIKPNQSIKLSNIAYAVSSKAIKQILVDAYSSGTSLEVLISEYIQKGTFNAFMLSSLIVDDMRNGSMATDEAISLYKSRLDFSIYESIKNTL